MLLMFSGVSWLVGRGVPVLQRKDVVSLSSQGITVNSDSVSSGGVPDRICEFRGRPYLLVSSNPDYAVYRKIDALELEEHTCVHPSEVYSLLE